VSRSKASPCVSCDVSDGRHGPYFRVINSQRCRSVPLPFEVKWRRIEGKVNQLATLCFASTLAVGCEFFSNDTLPFEAGPIEAGPVEAGRTIDESNDHGGLPAPWIEIWRDDFEGVEGAAPDPTKWTPEVTPRPANSELEYYTDRRDNSFLDGKGHLVIQAI